MSGLDIVSFPDPFCARARNLKLGAEKGEGKGLANRVPSTTSDPFPRLSPPLISNSSRVRRKGLGTRLAWTHKHTHTHTHTHRTTTVTLAAHARRGFCLLALPLFLSLTPDVVIFSTSVNTAKATHKQDVCVLFYFTTA